MFDGILNDIGQGALNGIQGIRGAAQQNPDAFLAAASGFAPKTSMGGMAGALYEHFTLQDKMKAQKEETEFQRGRQIKADDLAQAKLDETAKLNQAKIADYASKALKYGAPKKLSSYGGLTTMLGGDGVPFTIKDEEVNSLFLQVENNKVKMAELAAGEKAQAGLNAPPAVKLAQEQDANLTEAKRYLGQFKDLQDDMTKTGGISLASRILPNGISAMFNRVLGTQDGKLQAGVAKLNMGNFVKLVSGFPGSLSNAEGGRIEQALPKVDDDPALWKDFFDKYGPMLEHDFKNMQAKIAERDAQAAQTNALPSYSNGGAATIQQYPGKAGAKVAAASKASTTSAKPQGFASTPDEKDKSLVFATEYQRLSNTPDLPAGTQSPDGEPAEVVNSRKQAFLAELTKEMAKNGIPVPTSPGQQPGKEAPARKPLTAFQK